MWRYVTLCYCKIAFEQHQGRMVLIIDITIAVIAMLIRIQALHPKRPNPKETENLNPKPKSL